ncbi:MAG: hypothetical protein LBI11_00930 [Streptococcaceae bacterium]|jgi:hypothetical protein|nr:hypothetical protein [Streptococcaceae bacterium]
MSEFEDKNKRLIINPTQVFGLKMNMTKPISDSVSAHFSETSTSEIFLPASQITSEKSEISLSASQTISEEPKSQRSELTESQSGSESSFFREDQMHEKVERKDFVKVTKQAIKELERELTRQNDELQVLQNNVSEAVSRAEERFRNLSALIAHQKDILADYLGEAREEVPKDDIQSHIRPDSTKWWKRNKPKEEY